jgi:MFS family permease
MEHKVMICGLLIGVGIAIALVFGPLMAEITWAVTEDGRDKQAMSAAPYALAYGLYNTAFSGGVLVGPLLGGLIRDSAGWPTVCWVLGLITALTAVAQLLWVGHPLKLKLLGRAGASWCGGKRTLT